MIHPDTCVRACPRGTGLAVYATANIPKGTIVYADDPLEVRVSQEEFSSFSKDMQQRIEKYSFLNQSGVFVLSWDHAKYVNHCCQPNTLSTGWGFEIAIKDIYSGDEITDDYGLFNSDCPFLLECKGELTCRKRVLMEDSHSLCDLWDELIREALRDYLSYPQPLSYLLNESTTSEVENYVTTGLGYRSVRELLMSYSTPLAPQGSLST